MCVAVCVAEGVLQCVCVFSEVPLFAIYFGSVCCSSVAVCVAMGVLQGVLQCVLQWCCSAISFPVCVAVRVAVCAAVGVLHCVWCCSECVIVLY